MAWTGEDQGVGVDLQRDFAQRDHWAESTGALGGVARICGTTRQGGRCVRDR